jgi:chromosome segregation ATPase
LSGVRGAVDELQKTSTETGTKVGKLQDVEKLTRQDLFKLQNEISLVAGNLAKTDEAHADTIDTVKRNKLAFNDHVKEFKELEQEQRYLRAKFINLNDEITDKVKSLKDRHGETSMKMEQHRKESEENHQAHAKQLSDQKDAPEMVRKEIQAQLDKLKLTIDNHGTRADEKDRDVHKILKMHDQRHMTDVQSLRKDIRDIDDYAGIIPSQVAELQKVTGLSGGGPDRVMLLEEES